MRLRPAAAALLLVFAAAPSRAGLFGRSRVDSRWTRSLIEVNGDDSEWDDSTAFEEDGLAVMARNDAESLYLLITAHTRDAQDQLSGESRQDLALWFVGADGKTREWGARIPFSRRAPLTSSLRDPAGLDPEPEYVHYQGAQVSTAALPGDVYDRLAAQGRRPIWELRIPLRRLAVSPERSVDVDFVLNAPARGRRRHRSASGADERREAERRAEELVWNSQIYSLSVRLAPDPSQQR